MNKKHFTFFSAVSLRVLLDGVILFFCSCKPQTTAEQLEKSQYTLVSSETPCVYVCGIPKMEGGRPVSGEATSEHYDCIPLSNFLVSTELFKNPVRINLCTEKKRSFSVILNLCKKVKNPTEPGNLLMDWEIEYQGTVYPVKNISWNQKDLMLLWACGNGAVYLDRERKSSLR